MFSDYLNSIDYCLMSEIRSNQQPSFIEKKTFLLIIGQTACHRRAPLDGGLLNASQLKHGVPIEELYPDAGSVFFSLPN
jgi:hypothetical protein